MKNLFLGYTPYHVKISNCIASTLKKDENKIIIFQKEELINYVEKEVYSTVNKFFIDKIGSLNTSDYIKNPKLISQTYKEMCSLSEFVKKENIDRIFIFSDNPIYFQKIFYETKAKIIFLEEGTAIYNKIDFEKRTLKSNISFVLQKLFIYRFCRAKRFQHGKGGFEDYLVLREPNLVDSDSIKIKIDNKFLKKAFNKANSKKLNLKSSYLYCPAGTVYDKEKMLEITEMIFKEFKEKKNFLYVKLHPREKYTSEIKLLARKYSNFVEVIEDNSITSEDIVLQEAIIGIISDFSSMIMNVPYIREELEVYTTLDIMEKEYDIKLNLDISIFDWLREQSKIKDFREFKYR